jgi:hypothetical protein
MVAMSRQRDAILSQFDQYRHAPAACRHRGLAFYDAERMERKLKPDYGQKLLPPTGAIADWIREFCPDVELDTERVADGSIWNRAERDGLKYSRNCGRFHASASRVAAANEPAALPTQLDFTDFAYYNHPGNDRVAPFRNSYTCHASFTFVDPGFAAKARAAIERIRAGRLLAKDLPAHMTRPPKARPSRQRLHVEPDYFPGIGYTESTWDAKSRTWNTRRMAAGASA